MSTNSKGRPKPPPLSSLTPSKQRPRTMADVIGLAPTGSAEYILYSGLGEALAVEELDTRIKELELDKRVHSPTYRRIVIAYLQAELAQRSSS